MKKIAALLGVVILGVSAGTMHADGIGLPVTGTLKLPISGSPNWFTGTPVTIGSGVEFSYNSGSEIVAADFTGTSFTLTDTCVLAGCVNAPFEVTFTGPQILGYTPQTVTWPDGVIYNFVNNTLFIDSFGSATGKGGTLTFAYSSVPEPGTFGLLATGVLGAAGALRRRFMA